MQLRERNCAVMVKRRLLELEKRPLEALLIHLLLNQSVAFLLALHLLLIRGVYLFILAPQLVLIHNLQLYDFALILHEQVFVGIPNLLDLGVGVQVVTVESTWVSEQSCLQT